jgi:tRNA G18 (ribose-2'-O)-methylase SpoU
VFIAEGDVVVERAARAGYCACHALVDAQRTEPLPAGLSLDTPVFAASAAVLERITGLGVHRGMLACFARRPLPPADELAARSRRLLVLEGVNNPTNLGVITRSAVAFGFDGLLLGPTCTDPLYRRAARVSMGEVYALPYAVGGPLTTALAHLHDLGFLTVALTPASDAVDIGTIRYDGRVALLLGAEGHGLRAASMAAAHVRARIPIASEVDSLNVGVAAAIACYALSRG